MTLTVGDLQSDSDLDSIRNSCDVLYYYHYYQYYLSIDTQAQSTEENTWSQLKTGVDPDILQHCALCINNPLLND